MKTIYSENKIKILPNLTVLLLFSPLFIHAQGSNPDSSYQQQFNSFNNSIQKDFKTFRQNNDSVFLQYLTQSWKEFDAVQNKIPSLPKPINPPTYKEPVSPVIRDSDSVIQEPQVQPKAKPSPELNSPDSEDVQNPNASDLQSKSQPLLIVNTETVPAQAAMSNAVVMTKIAYFGTDFNVPSVTQGLPILSTISKQGIIGYFASASTSSILNTAAITLKKESDECRLNDWGFANLLLKAAQKMYSRQADQVMFTWFALLRNGYNVKVGYDKQNVYLLLPATETLYEISYNVNGLRYYLLNFGSGQVEPERLSIHEADYPQAKTSLSFMLTQTPELSMLFTNRTLLFSKSLELRLNKNLVDFYSIYPQCELKIFFKAPLSANATTQLDSYLLPVLENKKDDERVAFLLNFVHEAIRYKTDGQQFGHEKYLFADETLYYPAADCEDRAVLLAKLINRYTNCKTIGLSYPTHVSLAVNLTSLPNGKYITYNNLRYYHCDPTYIGASCGMPMSEFENEIPKIIDFD